MSPSAQSASAHHGGGVFVGRRPGTQGRKRGMRIGLWQRAIQQFFAPFDGDGGSGGAAGGDGSTPAASTTGTTAATSTTAAPGQGATTPPAATSDPPAPSANKLIKDFASERGMTVEALLGKFAELEDATKSEAQKAKDDAARAVKRAEAAEAALRDANGKAAVLAEAAKLNAISPNAVYELAKAHLQFADDGSVKNAAAAIAEVQKAEPKLFAASGGSGDGAATSVGNGGNTTNANVRPGQDRMRAAYETSSTSATKR